jgi:hypothetical protein
MLPNADGVNNGEWFIWYDNKWTFSTNVTGRSKTSSGAFAPIYSASGRSWPYAWSISTNDMVGLMFKLNQFGSLQKHPRLNFSARRAGVLATNYASRYSVGIFNDNALIGQCVWGPVPFSWQSDFCSISSTVSPLLNYGGGWNGMWMSVVGDGFGHSPDLLDVNYISLTIDP